MAGLIPWKRLEKKIVRYYAKAGSLDGRPAYPLPAMLRVHGLQLFYNLGCSPT
jgi:IS5 family transposase